MICVSESEFILIIEIIKKHIPECEVRAFGSRYTCTNKVYSDLDLAVVGKKKLEWHVIEDIKEAFEESDLPYRVDVLDWYRISPEFRKIIEQGYDVIWKGKSE